MKDAIRGCLIGGAVGDALGYAVEFVGEPYIFSKYGKDGITAYDLDRKTGKAIISDDTQMTLFTAAGLINAVWHGAKENPCREVELAYRDWYETQRSGYKNAVARMQAGQLKTHTWLMDVPALWAARAPGNTCLAALSSLDPTDDYIAQHRNNSKGCGGVMRVAPVAFYDADIETVDMLAAQCAAITHGHMLGYQPAAVLAHVIHRIVFDEMSVRDSVIDARDTLSRVFNLSVERRKLAKLIDLAVELSENSEADLANIHKLGEGWVGEEALAIALYCCLRYENDFSKCIIAAVNHKGDSDSTGAIAGNILGAKLGYEAIGDEWKSDLELHDTILRIADELEQYCTGRRLLQLYT